MIGAPAALAAAEEAPLDQHDLKRLSKALCSIVRHDRRWGRGVRVPLSTVQEELHRPVSLFHLRQLLDRGAAKVYAIEYSEIYKRCKREVTKKGLQHAVKVMNCLAEEVPIDPSEVDIIVSEWMGYFLLFERMLPSVLSVRDKCLKPGGIIIPNRVRIFLAAA